MRTVAWSVLIFLLANISALGQTVSPSNTIALHCGSLFDGRGDSLRKNVVIVIEGDKIKDVGGAAPAGAEVIDLLRETCLPGLIDTHTHILLNGDITATDYDEHLLKESSISTLTERSLCGNMTASFRFLCRRAKRRHPR